MGLLRSKVGFVGQVLDREVLKDRRKRQDNKRYRVYNV